MTLTEGARATVQLFRHLLSRSLELWDTASPIWQAIGGKRRALSMSELDTGFYASPIQIPPRNLADRVFPLPPIDYKERFIPLLAFSWDFRPKEGDPGGSLRLYMVPAESGTRPVRDGRTALHIMRFDLQEAGPPWGFAHVQSCDKEEIYLDWTGIDPKLVSPDVPRIPLAGTNLDAPGLLLTLVTGLYGVKSEEFSLFYDRDVMRASPTVTRLIQAFESPESTRRAAQEQADGRHR